ncbi:protein kinase [Candidatus Uabimicrobium sp. HlEnr_7]|uniref:protein kinase domain-containing protein n=1 Tax=Candidatus Uabimicrobium helgolandensis TaxID=3095367 RepID=UPI00355830EF
MSKNILAKKYQIICELGRGGMGIVYLAYDLEIKRKVAVKVIQNSETVASMRFIREARAIAKLEHPCIISVYESIKQNNMTYLVMEYVEGMTLDVFLQNKSLSLHRKIALFFQIVEAVHYAHEQNIIHRDLKPRNIIIDKEQNPYLLDFGLAKVINDVDRSITQSGQIVGTPKYMSPEQARGEVEKITPKSDIYSLGVILYEILTGKPLISKNSTIQILLEIIEKSITPPRHLKKSIPRSLEVICLKALQKKPSHRYKSAKHFANDLHKYQQNKSVSSFSLYKKYIAYAFFGLVILGIIFSYRSNFNAKPTTFFSITVYQEALYWLQRGFYQEAEKSFLEAYNQKLLSRSDLDGYMVDIYSQIGNKEKFIQHYKSLNPTQKNSISVKLAKAQMLFKSNKKKQARNLFSFVWKNGNAEQKCSAGYYLATQLIEHLKYKKALLILEQIKTINTEFKEKEHIDFLIGKCLFHKQKIKEAKVYLQRAVKNQPHFSDSYFYLGKTQSILQEYPTAEKTLRKSISLEKTNSYYFSELGKVLFHQKKYLSASDAFAQAKKLDHENMEAFEGYTKVAYTDVQFLRVRYVQVMYEINNFEYVPKDLLAMRFVNLASKYHPHYLQQQKVLNTKGNLLPLVTRLSSKDSKIAKRAYNALWLMRYHPNLQKVFTLAKFRSLAKIYKNIIVARKAEERYAINYLLAQGYFQPKMLASINPKTLIQILKNNKEENILRYLAAKALLKQLLFSEVIDVYKNGDNTQKIICLSAYKDIHLDLTLPQQIVIPQNTFLLSLYAKNHSAIDATKHVLDMLNHKNAYVALHTAHKYFFKKKLQAKCERVLQKLMTNKNKDIRAAASYFFWQQISKNTISQISKTRIHELWKSGLNDVSEVQLALLQNASQLKLSYIKSSINELLSKTSNISVHILAIKVFGRLKSQQDLVPYYANNNHVNILRAFAALKHAKVAFLTFMEYKTKHQDKGLIWLAQKFVPIQTNYLIEQPDEILRSYGYAIHSFMAKNIIPFISQEKSDDMKAVLLTFTTVGTGAFKIFTQLNGVSGFNSRKVKTETTNKYLTYPHENIRKGACYAYIYIVEKGLRDQLCEKILNNNSTQLRKAAARSLFYKVQNKVDAQDATTFVNYVLSSISSQQQTWSNVGVFKKHIKNENKRMEVKEFLEQILRLDSSEAEYHYYMFLTLKEKKHKAQVYLKKAYNLDKSNPMYLIDMFRLEKNKFFLKQIYKNSTSTNIPEMLSSICDVKEEIVKKILLQNYCSLTSKKDAVLRKVAWKNLCLFYKSKNPFQFITYDGR